MLAEIMFYILNEVEWLLAALKLVGIDKQSGSLQLVFVFKEGISITRENALVEFPELLDSLFLVLSSSITCYFYLRFTCTSVYEY